jgi:hypothetical protein
MSDRGLIKKDFPHANCRPPIRGVDHQVTTNLMHVKSLLNAIEFYGLKEKVGISWDIVSADVGEVVKTFPQPK